MARFFLSLTLTVLCILAATQICFAQISIDTEEYEVYSDLLKNIYGDDISSHFTIEKNIRSTFIDSNSKYVVKKLYPLDANLIRDFNERNNSTAELRYQFNLKSKINLVGDELDEIFKPSLSFDERVDGKDWDEFRKKYQSLSLLSLSRVGFNQKRDKALVVLGSQYGYLAGEGFYISLVKKNNIWKIKKKVRTWIS